MKTGKVISVARDALHRFSKQPCTEIRLITGQGVDGDAHCGEKVQHRSRVAIDPHQPNLRQVHLIAQEFLQELSGYGFNIVPGDLGENILTQGLALREFPIGTRLNFGNNAIVELTGLRNPCVQIEEFRSGLLKANVRMLADGTIERKTGVMAVVFSGGLVRVGDDVSVQLPPLPHRKLDRV